MKQFIFISFLGADLNNPVPLFQAKAEAEAMLFKKAGCLYNPGPKFLHGDLGGYGGRYPAANPTTHHAGG